MVFVFQLQNTFVLIDLRRRNFWFGPAPFISAVGRNDLASIGIDFHHDSALGSGAFFLFIIDRFGVLKVGDTGVFVKLFDNSCEK